MLKKLLKHEWRGLWKIPLLLLGILLIGTLALGFSFALPIWDDDWIGFGFSIIGTLLVYYALVVGVPLGINIYLVVRYYKSMFTDEGYLTHTLPATSHQLLISKSVVIGAWNLISGAAVGISVFIILSMLYVFQIQKEIPLREVFDEFVDLFRILSEEGGFGDLGYFMLCSVIMGLAGVFCNIMKLIGSISLGQMLRKHRILGAIGAYFGFNIIMSVVELIVTIPYMLISNNIDNMGGIFEVDSGLYLINAVLSIAVGLGLYFLSEYLTRRQLELE